VYGIIISLAILISSLLAENLVNKRGKDPLLLWDGLFWTILIGVIGARLYHVIDYWSYYSQDLVKILMFWKGGLGIIGGIIAGTITFAVYLKIKKENVFEWLDIAGLVVPLGQGLGRFGNIWNKELLPFAYYEMGCDFLLFIVLWLLQKRVKKKGGIFLLYIIVYSLIRLLLQPYRNINNL
jgi:phosphatidylglycerol---prolipoprotein diacylglyceryl transferase